MLIIKLESDMRHMIISWNFLYLLANDPVTISSNGRKISSDIYGFTVIYKNIPRFQMLKNKVNVYLRTCVLKNHSYSFIYKILHSLNMWIKAQYGII